jgi:hypothetical protein
LGGAAVMADGLVALRNLADVSSVDKAWDNLGNNVVFTVSGTNYDINVTGEDIIQLSGVVLANNEDLLQLRGITSNIQNRLNQTQQLVASGGFVDSTRLLSIEPSSSGNFIINQGVLSGSLLAVNQVEVGFLGGSPFVGSGAISPIYVKNLNLTSDFRVVEPFASGTLASGVKGVPVDYGSLILYVRAE